MTNGHQASSHPTHTHLPCTPLCFTLSHSHFIPSQMCDELVNTMSSTEARETLARHHYHGHAAAAAEDAHAHARHADKHSAGELHA
jgi:hypothetical protein